MSAPVSHIVLAPVLAASLAVVSGARATGGSACAPRVTTDPITQTVPAGEQVSFTAGSRPAGRVRWQVLRRGGRAWIDVAGATAPRLTLTARPADDLSRYRAAFANRCGRTFTRPATLLVAAGPTSVVNLPEGFAETRVASGFKDPTTVTAAPDGRIFVVEQGGTVRIVDGGVVRPTPFLKLTNVDQHGERGLESIAFDPSFETNHYVYVFYGASDPVVHNRVSRFAASGDVVDPASEVHLLDIEPATSTFHNGGTLRFGPDGDLYISTGDNLNGANAQSLANLKGKILRIRPDGTIPADNPFAGLTTGTRRAIWAIGLRNPYTFAFQPGTGRMLIDDVGLHTWEEIDTGVAGGNYGWPVHEGPSSDPAYVAPLHAYRHGGGPAEGCAVIGGAFYNPARVSFPARFVGRYFFADYCSGWIHALDPLTGEVTDFATNGVGITGLTVDPRTGDLYYLSRSPSGGSLYRIAYVGDERPRIDVQPHDVTVAAGVDAMFTVVPTGGQPFRYQWRRDGVAIPGASSETYTLRSAQPSDDGAAVDAVITNSSGSITSAAAKLRVAADAPPVATITRPGPNRLYKAGDVIEFTGRASDPEDGTEPARRFTWTVAFHHRDHEHPFLPPTSGVAHGSFTVPSSDFETDHDVYFQIVLTVTDSLGLSTTVTRDVHPRLAPTRIVTSPAGLAARLDARPIATPFGFVGLLGFKRTIGVPSPQRTDAATWAFDSWSDGGARMHTIAAPGTYTAVFRIAGGAVGTGSGLTATYYAGSDFSGAATTRVDPTVNVRSRSPGSVRWTGRLQPQFTQLYTLVLRSDEGARVLIDGKPVIEGGTDRARLRLVAGRRYAIEIDYANTSGAGYARLSWQSRSTPLSLVPSSELYP